MSDTPGTTLEPETVAGEVATDLDSLDPDELRTRLAQLEAEKKQLLSNIGRQNQIHGERLSRLEQELQAERAARQAREQEQQEAFKMARRAAMDPQSRLQDEMAELRTKLERQEQEQHEALERARQQAIIQDVLRVAKERGYDPDQVDTRSAELALISLDSLERDALRKKVSELESRLTRTKEETAETVANLSGRRMVATGGAATGTPRGERMSPEEKQLRDRLAAARARKDGEEIFQVRIDALALGIEL